MAEDGRTEISAKLLPASFRGVSFYVRGSSITGGRKAFERPIVNSSEQVVDDVGQLQRTYNVQGYVTAIYEGKTSNESGISIEYDVQRTSLLAALEAREPAALVHPIEGKIENLVAKSWSLDESINDSGIGRLSVTFVKETTRPVPVAVEGNKESVVSNVEDLKKSFLENLAEKFNVDLSFVQSYEDALGKVTEAYDEVQAIADSAESFVDDAIGLATAPLAEFSLVISDLTATAASVIMAPAKLADGIRNAFSAVNNIFPTAASQFRALQTAFDFGDLDVDFDFTTPSGKQKKQNFDLINTAVKGIAMADAYGAAVNLEYVTVKDIEDVENIMQAQHEAIRNSDQTDPNIIGPLEDLHDVFFDFLRDTRVSTKKVITEDVDVYTPRTLAYALYHKEADTFYDSIAGLNNVDSYDLIQGQVQVLSS